MIADGLNNPRHLTVGPDGAIFVAESGTGGDGPCIDSSEGNFVCYGPTGAITALTQGRRGWTQSRVVTGLPSLAELGGGGGSAAGPSDVEFRGRNYVVSIGLGADPAIRDKGGAMTSDRTVGETLPQGFGYLVEGRLGHANTWHRHSTSHATGNWRLLADVAGFEAAHNPIDNPDSNPSSLARVHGNWVVADAGANTVLAVSHHRKVSMIASFEDTMVEFPPGSGQQMPMQLVPTDAVAGPHGSYYVSQLTGFPFPENGATIWRVTPGHGTKAATVVAYATGLTNVTDLAVARNGDVYAVQLSTTGLASEAGPTNGSLVRISHKRGHQVTTVAGDLFAPYGVALDRGFAYVTTGSVLPGGGQVIQVPLGR